MSSLSIIYFCRPFKHGDIISSPIVLYQVNREFPRINRERLETVFTHIQSEVGQSGSYVVYNEGAAWIGNPLRYIFDGYCFHYRCVCKNLSAQKFIYVSVVETHFVRSMHQSYASIFYSFQYIIKLILFWLIWSFVFLVLIKSTTVKILCISNRLKQLTDYNYNFKELECYFCNTNTLIISISV